ncbi:hypothetical protein M9Y10_043286 [Tritrichomonas musculus]|uniref:Initiator binding domain-containing protein n=1 Tax=Tritrichomonas musculus TaxID=1915356 RepID=A0ABR2K269_9EUKA
MKVTTQQIQTAISSLPQYWQLLDRIDLEEYLKLRLQNEENVAKSKKGERIDSFNQKLDQIKRYIERDNVNQWKRSLVCGAIFLKDGIFINIQNFKMILSRCKSSINGSFQQMGYNANQCNPMAAQEIKSKIPFFSKSPNELKKWTFREFKSSPEIPKPEILSKKPFIIELPKPKISQNTTISTQKSYENAQIENYEKFSGPPNYQKELTAEDLQQFVSKSFPCPVKYRYKIYDTIYQSVSIQTEA